MEPNSSSSAIPTDVLLRVRSLSKQYVRGSLWHGRVRVAAVTEVDFEIRVGQTLALLGASGSGKSTVARCVTRLERPDAGQIWIEGTEIAQLDARAIRPIRPNLQMIFQDTATAMNPRFSAAEVLEEPLLILGTPLAERQAIVEQMMKQVALSPDWLRRPIMQFSGGQRQRLAIARALTLRPKLLVLDEAHTGLDLSVQAQITDLLLDLQARHSLTYLLISHDWTLVARMADTIAVMAGGRIVDSGTPRELWAYPKHEETRKLVASSQAAELRFAAAAGTSS
jgi:ABC-type glutathione transport system ATPase component